MKIIIKYAVISSLLGFAAFPALADTTAVSPAQTTIASTTKSVGQTAPNATTAAETVTLTSELDRLSYTLGAQLGRNLRVQGIPLDQRSFSAGLNTGLLGNKPLLSEQEMRKTITNFQKQLATQRAEKSALEAKTNLDKGETFLANNAKQPGVVVLPSGLQYKVVKAGEGNTPKENDSVTVNYVGTFIDGTVFDSSYKRGQPATFPISGVIPGWQQALKLMRPNAVWELFVPAKLAYGSQGMSPVVGPNQTLIFKVELLGVKPAAG